MKIALVILHADASRGGAERYTVDLSAALAAGGHDVTLLAQTFARLPAGVASAPLKCTGRSRLARYEGFLDALDRHLAAHRYDIVHAMLPVRRCDLYHPHAGIAAEAIARGNLKHRGRLRQRLSQVFTALNRKRQRFAQVERQLLEGSHPPIVLCLSDYVKAEVRRHYRLGEDRLVRLFNAVDLKRFDPAVQPEAGFEMRRRYGVGMRDVLALMVAQDFDRKGLGEAIRAVAQAADPSLRLLVVGRDHPKRYQRLAERLKLGQRVIFAGAMADTYAFYRAADFLVLPTRHDPCSLVVLEALAMGLPVISTRYNGACEIMETGRHGFVLDNPADVAALADAMRKLLDARTRREMSGACTALRPQLAYTNHVANLLGIYQRLSQPAAVSA